MALIVEDGSIVAGANSFVTLAEIKAYATARGITLPADATVETNAVLAFDYVNAQEPKMQGSRVSAAQEGCYPRECVTINGFDVLSTDIPKQIKAAQIQATVEGCNGVDLMPTVTEAPKKREKIGELETEWDTTGPNAVSGPSLPKVDALLSPLFTRSGVGIKTVRV